MESDLKDKNYSVIQKIKSMDKDLENIVKDMMNKKYSDEEKVDILIPKIIEIITLLNNGLKDKELKLSNETYLLNLKQKWICYSEFYGVSAVVLNINDLGEK